MDGKGRWMDNVFIERLWRSLKYEYVYITEFETRTQAKIEIKRWMDFYHHNRPHATFNGQTPEEVYNAKQLMPQRAQKDIAA